MSDLIPWKESARRLGRLSAETLFKRWPTAPDSLANAYLDQVGQDFRDEALAAGVPHPEIVEALDVLAREFVSRLDELDAASLRPGGRA
jgi:hypothetical protein